MSKSNQSPSLSFQSLSEGDWVLVYPQRASGKIIKRLSLWGNISFQVWLPLNDSIIRVDVSALSPAQSSVFTTHHLTYLATAARVADALNQRLFASADAQAGVLLAPIESSVIPLPHQIRALSRAISSDRVRYLLADEVGLGKTIEAGLIMRELKLRGLVKRTLVIAPKGLVTQWVAEMHTHFGEEFRLLIPGDFSAYRRIVPEDNLWQSGDQIISSMDSVKPMDKRRGWSQSRIAEYNRERFEDLISAGWDLVIVDEAHRLGGSTDQVARYRLGQGLAEAAPYLLLLSATPHQGKRDAFHRLISLVDAQAFPNVSSVTKERVRPYVIRTEKRQTIDAEGKPLFKPRRTELVPVSWQEHKDQRLLYEAMTEYVREGYNQAMRQKRNYIGFLMILMQRLVVSSTRAIRATLERRLEVLSEPQEQLLLFPSMTDEEWYDMDGEEQLLALLRTRLKAMKSEREEVELLLETAARCERQSPDVKAEALLDWIYRLQAEEGDPNLKVLVFTEFVPTQEMLVQFLTQRGFEVVRLNGSMSLMERKSVQDAFAKDARILISTDAGGEGINLQFCHVVINYDIPWNPMRLEQRIGRVDRIGQEHTVRAINFVIEDSVEHRVLEVLEEKLAVIFEEFGIDKTGDVLDSAQAGQIFDDLYVNAILNPGAVETKVDEVMKDIQEQAKESRQSTAMLGSLQNLDPEDAQKVLAHPLPHWMERMTVSYLRAYGGKAERKDGVWDLTWPDGERLSDVVFSNKGAEEKPGTLQLTLENPNMRRLVTHFPRFVPGQPVPVITLPDLASEITGFWSLWRISILTTDSSASRTSRIMPLFVADSGRVFTLTSRHIWDQLLTTLPTILRYLDVETSRQAFEQLRKVAEEQGKASYNELVQAHRERLAREREKGEYAFAARRRAIQRVGLPQVRNHRLRLLTQEKEQFREQLERRAQVLPDMAPVLLVRVEGNRE